MKRIIFEDKDYDLWVFLWQARDAVLKLREKELAKYGISITDTSVLMNIQAAGQDATPSKLARVLFREANGISTLVYRMVAKGLLKKRNDLDRRNIIHFSLTKKGRKTYLNSKKIESIHRVMSCLSEEEHQRLRSYLLRIRNRALEELGIPEPPYIFPRSSRHQITETKNRSV